ncbi:MAG: DUF2235 domain-containing protein, partial [Xanthomonadales bacterium]|nr:DUF2235 domain-containing protein [Xanthomonadales bacterium]
MGNRKNIVLCSDGTGNTMIKGRGTNVWKLYEAVDLTAHRWRQRKDGGSALGKEQIAFYDDGVGSEQNKILKIVGGAFGYGLQRNIRDLYKSLCRAYQPGDDIYIFGFSRGAYTARVLAGLILSCGIIRHDDLRGGRKLDELSKLAYKKFRSHFRLGTVKGQLAIKAEKKVLVAVREMERAGNEASESLSRKVDAMRAIAESANKKVEAAQKKAVAETDAFRREYSISDDVYAPDGQVNIKFIGVWDTVAAVGLPFKGLSKLWNLYVYPFMFPDYVLSSRVQKGCHAISVDDQRGTFHPMMWDERGEDPESDHLEQVWFPGVHSNVGGGYPKQGISLIALDWMIHRAKEKGLKFIKSERDRYRHLQNAHDKLYDSRGGLALYYRYRPRNIGKICSTFGIEPRIHVSVFERIALGTQDYAPGNLPGYFEIAVTDPHSGAELEDSTKLKQLVSNLDEETAAKNVDFWIRLRRLIYFALVAVTLVIVAGAGWYHGTHAKTATWVPDKMDKALQWIADLLPFGKELYGYLLRPFLIYWGFALTAVALLVLFWATSKFAQSKLQSTFA